MVTGFRGEDRAVPRRDYTNHLEAATLEPLEGRLLLSSGISLVYEQGPNIGQTYSGPITIKVSDFEVGTLYPMPGGPIGYSGLPGAGEDGGVAALDAFGGPSPAGALPLGPWTSPGGPGPGPGLEDFWGIGKFNSIHAPAADNVWTPLGKGHELNILFWGGQDIHVEPMGAGDIRIGAVGMHIDVYSNPLNSFSALGGTGARGPTNTYPNITNGVLELSMVALPGFINIPGVGAGLATAFESRFNFTSTTGDGEAFVELIPGTASYATFNTDGFAMPASNAAALGPGFDTTADFRVQFDTSPAQVADWLVTSDDPIKGNFVIPEPSSLCLLGLGGLAVLRRRRQGKPRTGVGRRLPLRRP